jgi:hypothetical protein
MAHTVFISYSHKDKSIADAICFNLESAEIRCWIAPRDISPGLDWPTAISNAVAASRIMVLVFSANSNSSEDVGRELILAANNKLIIIPFKIDNIMPEPGKQYYLARTHWLDAINPPTQAQIDTLVRYVRSFLSADETGGTGQPARVAGRPVEEAGTPARKRRVALWIAGGLALIILCSALGALLWNQRTNLPFLSNFLTTQAPTTAATSTLSLPFTSTPTPTLSPIPPTPTSTPTLSPNPPTLTPTPTGTPDLREKNPSNNHLYLLVETRQIWHVARDTCTAWGGHLATIQDTNENAFVYRLAARVPYSVQDPWIVWLGATDEIEEGIWVWVTGESWSWDVWDKRQPDNYATRQHFLAFSQEMNLKWDDLDDGDHPFICEWEIVSP